MADESLICTCTHAGTVSKVVFLFEYAVCANNNTTLGGHVDPHILVIRGFVLQSRFSVHFYLLAVMFPV